MPQMLKLNLIENALDSLENAINHLTDKTELTASHYKKIINNLAHVTELLFKERLRMIHPAFILTNVDKYPSKNAHTVSSETALKRLINLENIEFSHTDQSALKFIREKRNEIEHYEFILERNEAKIIIGNLLVFIFKFSSDEVKLNWSERRLNDPTWSKLNEYAEYYQVQLKYTLKTLSDTELPIIDCPICNNETFNLDEEICLLCGHKEEVLRCMRCDADYFYSIAEFEDAELCQQCEWDEGYAAANFEKY